MARLDPINKRRNVILYLIKFKARDDRDYIKLGITTRSVKYRFHNYEKDFDWSEIRILRHYNLSKSRAEMIETIIHNSKKLDKFKAHHQYSQYLKDLIGWGYTEIYLANSIDNIYTALDYLLKLSIIELQEIVSNID